MDFQINFSTENIHSFDDFVEVKQTHNGRDSFYKMSLKNLLDSLSASIDQSRVESPLLPYNCIKFVYTSVGYEVYTEVPKKQWMINYNGNYFKVGFPRMIFRYNLFQKVCDKTNTTSFRVDLTNIVAIKADQQINGSIELYNFPFSHVSDSDARVCMGGNVLKDIKILKELEDYHVTFIHSPFSNDYGAKVKSGKPVHELFSDTYLERDFDDSELISLNQTFNEFFNLNS